MAPGDAVERPSRAVILVAGGGGRLRPLTEDRPKGLLEVGDRSIVEHQIACLRWAGVREIALITGHGREKVLERCGNSVVYFHNERYRETNSLYSAYLARDFAAQGCLILNSDVLFHPDLLERLLAAPHGDCLIVDRRSGLGEEEMKVLLDSQGRLLRISKDIDPSEADGENLGIVRLSRPGAQLFFQAAEAAFQRGEFNHWVPFAINQICQDHPFYSVPAGDLPWIEIDYMHDLRRARSQVYPKMRDALRAVERGTGGKGQE